MKIWTKIRATFTPKRRRYIYRVVNACIGAAVVYGLASGEEAAALGLVVNAVLGMADANVTVGGDG